MLTALPPEMPVATEDDRPIVIGRVERPDYYVLAHEAKNRGDHSLASTLLMLAADALDVPIFPFGDSLVDWESHIEAVDRAWGERQALSPANPKPARDPIFMKRIPGRNLFVETVVAYEGGAVLGAALLLQLVATMIGFEGDWSGTLEQDWARNFDGVHRAWVEHQAARHD